MASAAAAAAAQATHGKASPATPAEEHHLSLQTSIVGTTQSSTELHRTAVYTTKQVPRHSAAQSGLKVTIRHIHHTEPIAYETTSDIRAIVNPRNHLRTATDPVGVRYACAGRAFTGGVGMSDDEWGGGGHHSML